MVRAADLEARTTTRKGQGDYVTPADREAQRVIVELLAAATPELPVLAEEADPPGPDRREAPIAGWVVDPLDGTTNFARGFPLVGVSVALVEDGEPVAGAVAAPFLGRSWLAHRGGGARDQDGRPLRIAARPVAEAVVATGFPFRLAARRPAYLRMLAEVLARVEDGRRAGAAAIDLALTAQGVFDGFFELGLRPWDVAAGMLLVTEAGGRVSGWDGGGGALASGDVLAGSPAVHAALLEAAAAAGFGVPSV